MYETSSGYESLPTQDIVTSDMIEGLGGAELPSRVLLDDSRISLFQNQNAAERTKMACGAYSVIHAQNAMNVEEGSFNTDLLAPEYWEIQIKEYRGSPVMGSYQKDNLDMMVSRGFILGYYRARDPQAIKEALHNGNAVSTGSYKIDRTKTRASKDKVAVIGKGSSHLFPIVGYDDDLYGGVFICKNSVGDKFYDKGLFYIKYTDLSSIYTTYVMVDKDDFQIIKDQRHLKEAINIGITNGLFLEAYATREQAALMIGRSLYGVASKDDLTILKTMEAGIWNGEGKDALITRDELAIMIARSLGQKGSDQSLIEYAKDVKLLSYSGTDPIMRLHMVYVVMRAREYNEETTG